LFNDEHAKRAISTTSALLQQREENGFQERQKFNMNLARGPLDFAVLLLYITTLEIKYNHIWLNYTFFFLFQRYP
jgi:hypothetical protein